MLRYLELRFSLPNLSTSSPHYSRQMAKSRSLPDKMARSRSPRRTPEPLTELSFHTRSAPELRLYVRKDTEAAAPATLLRPVPPSASPPLRHSVELPLESLRDLMLRPKRPRARR